MLNVGINLTEIQAEYKGGINTYTHGLIQGFSKIKDSQIRIKLICVESNYSEFEKYIDDKFIFMSKISDRKYFFKVIKNILFLLQNKYFFKKFSNYLWQDAIKISDSCDFIYWPTTVLNFFESKAKTLVSMHDIQHIHYPNFFSIKERLVRNLFFPLTIEHVNYIQVSSEFIKKDLLNNFRILKKKQVYIIGEGVAIHDFSRNNKINVKKKYFLPKEFIYYPAQLWPHKNHETIIKALGYLLKTKNKKINLVLTGADYGFYKKILDIGKNENVSDQIFYLGLVEFKNLLQLYKQARFIISAALYESNSLPILEGAASGTAIIACDTPPNKELKNKLKLFYFPVKDYISLSKVIEKVWYSKKRKENILINKNNIKQYEWTNVAKQYLNLFKSV